MCPGARFREATRTTSSRDGDSEYRDTNWPKTLLYIAGWGIGHAALNGELLHEDYQVHFMVTQGIRDRETLEAHYPLLNKKSTADVVNSAAQQRDVFIRSPEANPNINPTREVYRHFFAMKVTWKSRASHRDPC